ncbi:Wzy polymerase domain-containing protein [Cronobacter dublinensis]
MLSSIVMLLRYLKKRSANKLVTLFILLWLCGGLLWMLPNHGHAGLALPQNLLAWCVLALIALCCALFSPQWKVAWPPGTYLILAGTALWSLPLFWSPRVAWQWNALPKVLALWGLVGIWLLMLKSTRCHLMRRGWLLIMVISALLQVGFGVVQLSDIAHLTGGRPYGSFQQVNVLASFLATGMICALWLFLGARERLPAYISATALVVIPVMLVLLQSRAGGLGAVSGALVLLLAAGKNRRRTGYAVLLLMMGAGVGVLTLYVGPLLISGFIPELVQKESSNVQRWYLITLTWQLLLNHPLIGNGYGSFETLFGQMVQQVPLGMGSATIEYPHNEFLYTWMEGGLVAVAGIALMIIGILRRLWGKGGCRWPGLAVMLPLALHMNLEYPLYQSVTHGMTLVMLLTITGPAARKTATLYGRFEKPLRIGVGLLACSVLAFMISGVVTEVQLTRIEQQGLVPFVYNEQAVIESLANSYSQYDRLDFDRHVALLLRFNITRDAALLTRFRAWAEHYLAVHNDPAVYTSLLMIYRSQGEPLAQSLCVKAKAMWPDDPRFNCF